MRYHAEFRAVGVVDPCRPGRPSRRRRRKGAALVEFALIALVLYLLLAVTIEMGRSLYSAQLLQQAADVAAREISRTPLPPNPEVTLERMLYDRSLPSNARVLRDIYSEDFLVIDIDRQVALGQSFVEFFADKPIVNRQLLPLMIYEEVGGRRLLRYPGALFTSQTAPSGLTVAIPAVVARASDGAETIEWVRVLEEVKPPTTTSIALPGQSSGTSQQQQPPLGSGNNDGLVGPVPGQPPFQAPPPVPGLVPSAFPITSPQRGVVVLRLNYPYQAAALSAYQPNNTLAAPSGVTPRNDIIEANDGSVQVQQRPDGFAPGTPIGSGQEVGPYAGPYALGRHFALGKSVRPYRKLLTSQAIYRREVYSSPEGIP